LKTTAPHIKGNHPEGDSRQKTSVTRLDLAARIRDETRLPLKECSTIVDSILWHIENALVQGEVVKISSFGTFRLRDKAGRAGRNPATGSHAHIEPRRVITFHPSRKVRARVNEGQCEK